MNNLIDIFIGQKIGKWTVLSCERTGNKRLSWKCVCECGRIKNIPQNRLKAGTSKSCGCGHLKKEQQKKWKGFGDLRGETVSTIKRGAVERGLEFDITAEYLWNLFLKQNKICVYSGVELILPQGKRKQKGTASLDRIDNNKGYVSGNVQWVHKDINRMKWCHSSTNFIKICGEISRNKTGIIDNDLVVTSGYFNPLHRGHIELFKESCKISKRFIVIVNNDKQRFIKKSLAFQDEQERMSLVRALTCVDDVVLSIDEDQTICETLRMLKPRYFTRGGDRSSPENMRSEEIDVCKEIGCEIIYGVGGSEKITSSSSILLKVINNFREKYHILSEEMSDQDILDIIKEISYNDS